MSNNLEVWINRDFGWGGYSFYFRERHGPTVAIAQPLAMKELEFDEEAVYHDAAFRLPQETMQALCDQIHQVGFRPSRAVDTDKAVEQAQENHIKDLNSVVSNLFELVKKE